MWSFSFVQTFFKFSQYIVSERRKPSMNQTGLLWQISNREICQNGKYVINKTCHPV